MSPCSTRRSPRAAATRGSRSSARRTPTSSRWARPRRTRRGGRRGTRGTRARAGRLGRGHGSCGLGRARAVGPRLGHGRLDQAAVRALRQRGAAADVRDGLALRRRGVRVQPRPDRPGREDRARRRAPVLDHRGTRPARLDHGRAARGGAAAGGRAARRAARRRPERARRSSTAIEPGVRAAFERSLSPRGGARRRARRVRPPALVPLRDAVLLPRRARGGVLEPRALRRRPLRAPHRGGHVRRDGRAHARRRLRAEPKRRIMLGTYALSAGYYEAFYGQAQKVRTLLIREHREALRRST